MSNILYEIELLLGAEMLSRRDGFKDRLKIITEAK